MEIPTQGRFRAGKSCRLLLRGPVRTVKPSSFSTGIAAIFHMLPITGPFPTPLKRPLAHDTVLFQKTFLFQNPLASRLHEESFILRGLWMPSASFSPREEKPVIVARDDIALVASLTSERPLYRCLINGPLPVARFCKAVGLLLDFSSHRRCL